MDYANGHKLDRILWIIFAILFVGLVGTTWLPVKPVILGIPFWAVIALGIMLVSGIVAGIAGWYYEWPSRGEYR